MNYLEEQLDGEAMINSIQNADHPFPIVTQVSLAGTVLNAIPTLKDPKFWTAEEIKTQNIDHIARSLLIQGLPNDIYSLIDSNDTAKIYGMLLKGRCVVLMTNDLKKCSYKKDKCELNYKFLKNLQPEWKQYGTLMRQTNNLMDINIDALYNILKQNQGDVIDALGYKKKAVVVNTDPLALVAEKTKITALLAKDFKRKKYYAKPTNNNLRTSSASSSTNKEPEYVNGDSDHEVNANMVFMAKMEKVLSDLDESSSFAKETIAEDNLYNGRKGIGFENSRYFGKAKDLRPSLYDERVIGLGYTPMFITHSNKALEIEKFKTQTSSLKPYVPTMILEKIIIDLEAEVVNLFKKEKENLEIIESLKSKDTLSSVRRPKLSGVMWMKKGSSNTVKADLSSVNHSNLNKNVKRYSCKDLMLCNISHHRDTRSGHACNNARNAYCNSYDVDVTDLFIFNDVSLRKSHVSKMPFRKKLSASLNVPSRSKLNKSLPRIMRKWLPKLQPLAEPIAKWIPKVKRQIDKISKTPNSSGPIFEWVPKIMNSSTMNVETSNVEIPSQEEKVVHESSESFQEESSSSSLDDDVQQSREEVILPQTNTQSISNDMIPNVDEASISHNVFNECLEDAYFDASTSFHDPSIVYIFINLTQMRKSRL
nr:hypothetical protein [Tanacetum cinerariifolium]